MVKCKWCEKEILDKKYTYCDYDCRELYLKTRMRKIIFKFAQEMEKEMLISDSKGYTHIDKSLKFLVDKLNEERQEVDLELKNLPSFELRIELVHEAILTMLVNYNVSASVKHSKLED